MKIDIRDDVKKKEVDRIAFATKENGDDQAIQLGVFNVLVECNMRELDDLSQVSYDDIPNLIKALLKVCELKGIKL